MNINQGDLANGFEMGGLLTARDGLIFKTVFGTRAAQIKNVVNIQFGWPEQWDQMFQFLRASYGQVTAVIDSMAVAPYIQYDSSSDTGSEIIASMQASLQPGGATYKDLKRSLAEAQKYGISLVAYEAGPGIASSKYVTANQDAFADPGLYSVTQQEIELWNTLNPSQLFNIFTDFTLCGDNCFGSLPYESALGSQQWDALMDLIFQPGDINQDGVVNQADCEVLFSNYKQPGPMWRIQGDLNDDGVVNELDLEILNSALKKTGQPACVIP